MLTLIVFTSAVAVVSNFIWLHMKEVWHFCLHYQHFNLNTTILSMNADDQKSNNAVYSLLQVLLISELNFHFSVLSTGK